MAGYFRQDYAPRLTPAMQHAAILIAGGATVVETAKHIKQAPRTICVVVTI
jgi:hypothetical protein